MRLIRAILHLDQYRSAMGVFCDHRLLGGCSLDHRRAMDRFEAAVCLGWGAPNTNVGGDRHPFISHTLDRAALASSISNRY